jgi:SagB-type dehydrogenase family enzyme
MPKIVLPPPSPLAHRLDEILAQRRSCTEVVSNSPLTQENVGTLFGHALGKRERVNSRNYPSGGALFPIETYLVGSVLNTKTAGIFHYHVASHCLEHLWDLPADFRMEQVFRSPNIPLPQALIVFTSVWHRTTSKYGEFGYYLAMLEAGHMAQNILLTATALNIRARPVGGFDDNTIVRLLDIDGREEQPIYSILLCGDDAGKGSGLLNE